MGMIRVYRHPSGTAPANPTFVRQYDDTDGGAFVDAATVSAGTLPAGTYDITVTNQDTGKAVSGYSNALSLTVNAAGASDDFAGDGALNAGLWELASGCSELPARLGGVAVSSNGGAAVGARLQGSWSAAQEVIAQIPTAGDVTVTARMTDVDNCVGAVRGGTTWSFRYTVGGTLHNVYDDPTYFASTWVKIAVAADGTVNFYLSSDGSTWGSVVHTIASGLIAAGGNPGFFFWYTTTPSVDNFSAT